METKVAVAKRAKLDQLVRDKDEYIAQFRKQATALTSELEKDLSEKRVAAQIEAMNADERQAMLAGLAKEG